jgi:hypothetical protein
MRSPLLVLVGLCFAVPKTQAQDLKAAFDRPFRIVDSIPAPESVAVGPDHAWYVSSFGKFDVKGDGAVYRVDPDKQTR